MSDNSPHKLNLSIRQICKVEPDSRSVDEVVSLLKGHLAGAPRDKDFAHTLETTVKLIQAGVGGTMIVVLAEECLSKREFDFACLDDGHLQDCFEGAAPNIHTHRLQFEEILTLFTAHGETDRWEQHELEALVKELPAVAEKVAKMRGRAKDGAIVLSQSGTVLASAMNLKYPPKHWQLVKDGQRVSGTRHAGVLGFAEYLSGIMDNSLAGVVFVRSDAGGVHTFLPLKTPVAYHCGTKQHPSQEEVLAAFKNRVMHFGQQMVKMAPSLARPGHVGESVKTIVGGRTIAQTQIENDYQMIVEEATEDRHLYVLTLEKFKKRFLWNSCVDLEAPTLSGPDALKAYVEKELTQKREQGFKLYCPNPDIRRWMYRLTSDDISKHFSTGFFHANWGALLPVLPGDFLAVPHEMDEVYLIPTENFCLYAPWSGTGKLELKSTARFLPQSNMMVLFQKRIQEEGKILRKTGTVMARSAEVGEVVSTRVNGRVTSTKVVVDPTDKVVRSSTATDLYVLTKAKFEASYDGPVEDEGDSDSPLQRMLSAQRFETYKSRPDNLRWVYELTEKDVHDMGVAAFKSSWGAVQRVQPGDFLSIPYNAPTEIYLMPAGLTSGGMYESVPADAL
jgi:hypothetical protein